MFNWSGGRRNGPKAESGAGDAMAKRKEGMEREEGMKWDEGKRERKVRQNRKKKKRKEGKRKKGKGECPGTRGVVVQRRLIP